MTDLEKILLIKDWAQRTNPSFDCSFVDDLYEKITKFGSLTENQSAALDRIIGRWGIEE